MREPARREVGILQSSRMRWVSWANRVDIRSLVLIPILLGILTLFLAEALAGRIYGRSVPESYRWSEGALGALIMSVGGLAQAWRGESLGPLGGVITGRVGVALGWLWAVLFWAAAFVFLVLALKS